MIKMRGYMVQLSDERHVDTLRQISLLLDCENQRLVAEVRQLTVELARVRGVSNADQLEPDNHAEISSAQRRRRKPGSQSGTGELRF